MYVKEYSIKIMISCLKSLLLIYASTLLYGCSVTRSSSKYNFSDGYYYSKLNGNRSKKYYVASSGDSIKVYPADIAKQNADTIKSITVLFPPNKKPLNFQQYKFRALGLDLTVISIVVKYRPAVKNFPAQLNNTLNGAIYAGYRTDNYFLKYENTPLHVANRKITHHGYSIGGFAGLGSVHIDEYVTLNRINYEYDGAVITSGIAAEFGFNKINFGLVLGLDFLTDENRHVWVNEEKPWLGLNIGLKLN